MSGTLLRIRRRRRLAAALRWTAAQEAPRSKAALAPLDERLAAIAASQDHPAPAASDLPERLARLDHGGAMPPEVVAMLAAILTPLQTLLARSTER
jgi:type III secretion system FlhB-like substrate exporter